MTRRKLIYSIVFTILCLAILATLLQFLTSKYLNSTGLYIPIILIIGLVVPIFFLISALRDNVVEIKKDTSKTTEAKKTEDESLLKKDEPKKDEKKKDDSKKSDKKEVSFWGSRFLDYLLLFLIVISVGYFWGEDIGTAIRNSKISISQNNWIMWWERSYDQRNRVPDLNKLSISAKISIHDNTRLEFFAWGKDQNGPATITVNFKGKRNCCIGKHYDGFWVQGNPKDSYYDYGTWRLEEINDKKFSGSFTDKTGTQTNFFLEKSWW